MEGGAVRHFLYPGTIFVSPGPAVISTILGSCVAVCLWDPRHHRGGMNHYLLPLWNGDGLATPRYGDIATEKLLDRMLEGGSRRRDLVAKVFGGAAIQQQAGEQFLRVGERNIDTAYRMLGDLSIPVVGTHVGGSWGKKIYFDTVRGEVLVTVLSRENR